MLQFEPNMRVGIDVLDDQHKSLIGALNRLMDALWDGKGREEVCNSIKFLLDYTATHFADEEEWMERYRFPELEGHRLIHRQFVERVQGFAKACSEGNITSDLAISTFYDTWDWLKDHILKTDKRYGKFITERMGLSQK
jgi:hemerythrin-like metal-binding domain